MRDGRPNPDIWGNIITCIEIGEGIYCIIGSKKKGIDMPKEVAEEILPESAVSGATVDQDGSLCFTDPIANAMIVDALAEKKLAKSERDLSVLDTFRQLDDPETFTGFEQPITDMELDSLELE